MDMELMDMIRREAISFIHLHHLQQEEMKEVDMPPPALVLRRSYNNMDKFYANQILDNSDYGSIVEINRANPQPIMESVNTYVYKGDMLVRVDISFGNIRHIELW